MYTLHMLEDTQKTQLSQDTQRLPATAEDLSDNKQL